MLLVLVLAYTALFSTLWILRYRALFSYEWEDEAARNQMIYNTLRGAPFWTSIKGVRLAGHATLIWAVFAVPSLVYPGIETAYVLMTLGLGLSVVPAYLVGRAALGSRGRALLVAAAFLLYPPLHAVNLNTLNGVTAAVPLLAWAFWAFHSRRFKTFLGFALAACLCKEDVALAVMMFGLLAAFQRRRWYWCAAPALLGAAWLAVAFGLVIPGTHPQVLRPTSWIIGARQWEDEAGRATGQVGGLSEAIRWIVRHPGAAVGRMFTADRALLFLQLFAPVALVAFLAPGALLMAVPALGQILLHDGPLPLYHRHWIAPVVPFVMMATVLGLARVKGRRDVVQPIRKTGSGTLAVGSPTPFSGPAVLYGAFLSAVVIGCAAGNLAPNIVGTMRTRSWGWPAPEREMQEARTVYAAVFYRPTKRSRDAWALIGRIPPGASVAASGDLLVPLSSRRRVYEFLHVLRDGSAPWRDAEYLLVNTRLVYFGAGHYTIDLRWPGDRGVPPETLPDLHRRRVEERLAGMQASGDWTLVERRGDIVLLCRRNRD